MQTISYLLSPVSCRFARLTTKTMTHTASSPTRTFEGALHWSLAVAQRLSLKPLRVSWSSEHRETGSLCGGRAY